MKPRIKFALRLISVLLLLTSVVALAACKGKTATTTTTAASQTSTTTTTNTTTTTTTTTNPTTATSTVAGTPITINLTAQNMAFDKSTITVPVGAKVTLILNNKDVGIPHNFALYTNSSASDSIFQGQTITGPGTVTYTFTSPSTSGTYFFRCDIHPNQMQGNFIVQ